MSVFETVASQPWKTAAFDDPTVNVRSMISLEEKRLLHWLARTWYSGDGEIVDLGCFVGAETVVFADGVLRNRRRASFPNRPRVHAFELFPHKIDEQSAQWRSETTLINEYWDNIAPFAGAISTYAGDLRGIKWPASRKIEILFNDASKSPDVNFHVIREFFPHLTPGRSVLIQQDYYDDRYWVSLSMAKLEGFFRPFAGPIGGTRAYLYTEPLNEQAIAAAVAVDWPADLALLEAAAAQTEGWRRELMALGCARFLIRHGAFERAEETLQAVQRKWPDHEPLVRRIRRLYEAMALRRDEAFRKGDDA